MGVAAILSTILLGLLANEVWMYQPLLQKVIIKLALFILPAARRDIYREEWPLVLRDAPAEMTRTFWALWFIPGALLFRIGDSLTYLKARLLRYVPIIDDQKFHLMWMEDLIAMMKDPDVTVLDFKDTPISEKETQTEIRLHYNHITRRELAKKLGLSRASDKWQLSPPVKLLRRGYGLIKPWLKP